MTKAPAYFREGRVIFRVTPAGTRVRVATARTAVGAALTVKVLRGEIAGDWRKYIVVEDGHHHF